MTKITPIYPQEFKKIEYTAYWQDIDQKFNNSFGDLKELIVNIHIKIMESGEQIGVNINEEDNIATIDVYFVRYYNNNKLTPLSSPSEFYDYIETVLKRVSEDFK